MLQLLLDGQDDKQIYIIFFVIYKLPTKEKKKTNKKNDKAQVLDFSPNDLRGEAED